MPSFVRSVRALAGVIALLVLPLTAAAQPAPPSASAPASSRPAATSEPNSITVTPFLSSAFGVSQDLDASLGLGVAVTYDLTPRLGFEGELAHVFDVQGDDANVDLAITNFSGNVVYNFAVVPHVTPYGTFGVGVEHAGIDVKTPDPAALYPASSTEVSYNFGGGVKVPVSDMFVARVDIRRFQANDLAPDYWRLYGGVTWWIKR
jgi:opacity protein-like surface antigen